MEKLLSKEYELYEEFLHTSLLFCDVLDNEPDGIAMAKGCESLFFAIGNFGICELYARQAAVLSVFKIDKERQKGYELKVNRYNERGLRNLDFCIKFVHQYRNIEKPASSVIKIDEFKEILLEMKTVISFCDMKPKDAEKILFVMNEATDAGCKHGEKGIIEYIEKNVSELKRLRLNKARGTEDNLPFWKIAAIAIMCGIAIWKTIRCITKGKCCSGIDDKASRLGMTIAAMIAKYC